MADSLSVSILAEGFGEELTPKPVTRTDTADSEGDVLFDRTSVLAGPWSLMIVEVRQYAGSWTL